MHDTPPRTALYRTATRAAWVGLLLNLALGVVKLAGGILGQSFALISDAVNSLGDAVTSVVVVAALYYAQRPRSEQHPYGFTRAEAVAGSNVAVLVIVSALLVGWEALQRLHTAHPLPPAWTLWIAAGNVAIKEALYRYKSSVARRTGSSALIANAWDHRSDALCSLAVLVGLAAVRWGGPAYVWADEAAALVVVAAILWTGVGLFRNSARELLDVQADPDWLRRLRDRAGAVPGVRGVEKLWVRKSGLEYFADIHIEVDGRSTVDEGHRVGHLVKDELMTAFPTLRDVLVHIEPFPHRDAPAAPNAPSSAADALR